MDTLEEARLICCKAVKFALLDEVEEKDIDYSMGRVDGGIRILAMLEHHQIIVDALNLYRELTTDFLSELIIEKQQALKEREKNAIGIARFRLAECLLNSKTFGRAFSRERIAYGVILPLGGYEELEEITEAVITAYKAHI